MDLYFDSNEASLLNKQIFETIYFASLTASNEIAIERNNNMQQIKTIIEESNILLDMNDKSKTEIIDYIENDTINKKLWDSLKPLKEEIIQLDNDIKELNATKYPNSKRHVHLATF